MRTVLQIMACAMLATVACIAPADARNLDRRGLVQTFNDEFDTLTLANPNDRQTWTAGAWKTWYQNSPDPFNLHNRTLPGNGEHQVYTDAAWPKRDGAFPPLAHTVENGVLKLRADRAPPTFRAAIFNQPYTSGMITSWGMFDQRYGVFEARMKLPKGRGLWPAFWTLNAVGGNPPEIDILEHLGHDVHSTWVVAHTRETGRHTARSRQVPHAIDITEDYHVYAIDWRPQTLTWYIDDVEVLQIPTPADMNRSMYMVLNLAVGGRWGGMPDAQTVFPATLDVDYVRVWRRPGAEAPPRPPATRAKKKAARH